VVRHPLMRVSGNYGPLFAAKSIDAPHEKNLFVKISGEEHEKSV